MAYQRGWPYGGQAASRAAWTLTPDGELRSNRSLVGPLRWGTRGDAGPSGIVLGQGFGSDMGMDRVSRRCHDPIGRVPYTAVSELSNKGRTRR